MVGGYQQGVTLVELMVVVAIVAILATTAMPNYQRYVIKTQRREAESALMQLSQVMERHYGVRFSYLGAAQDGADTGAPANFSVYTPIHGGERAYQLSIRYASDSEYWLQAEPLQRQRSDRCGSLYLHVSGRRGSDNASGACWNGTQLNQPP
jgi:type IV pilus assembly protein PilE